MIGGLGAAGCQGVGEPPVAVLGDIDQPVPGQALVEGAVVGVVDRLADAELEGCGASHVGAAAVVGVQVGQLALLLAGDAGPVEVALGVRGLGGRDRGVRGEELLDAAVLALAGRGGHVHALAAQLDREVDAGLARVHVQRDPDGRGCVADPLDELLGVGSSPIIG